MAVIVVDYAAAFDAVATILPLLLTTVATNPIAGLPLTAAAQLTTTTAKAINKQLTLAVDGSQLHCRCHH